MIGWTGFATEPYVLMKTVDMRRLLAALDVVRKDHSHISIGMLHALLTAADLHDDLYNYKAEMSVLASELEVPYSTLTRQYDTLGEGVAKRGGPGLVEKVLIEGSAKLKVVALTERGTNLLKSIASAMSSAGKAADEEHENRIARFRRRLEEAQSPYQMKP